MNDLRDRRFLPIAITFQSKISCPTIVGKFLFLYTLGTVRMKNDYLTMTVSQSISFFLLSFRSPIRPISS